MLVSDKKPVIIWRLQQQNHQAAQAVFIQLVAARAHEYFNHGDDSSDIVTAERRHWKRLIVVARQPAKAAAMVQLIRQRSHSSQKPFPGRVPHFGERVSIHRNLASGRCNWESL